MIALEALSLIALGLIISVGLGVIIDAKMVNRTTFWKEVSQCKKTSEEVYKEK
jgi:hypothetical protein